MHLIRVESGGNWVEYRHAGGGTWRAESRHGGGTLTTAQVLEAVVREVLSRG